MPKEYKIQEGQSIDDVAIQLYGHVERSFDLLLDNPHLLRLDNTDLAGLTVVYDETKVQEQYLASNFATKSTIIATTTGLDGFLSTIDYTISELVDIGDGNSFILNDGSLLSVGVSAFQA